MPSIAFVSTTVLFLHRVIRWHISLQMIATKRRSFCLSLKLGVWPFLRYLSTDKTKTTINSMFSHFLFFTLFHPRGQTPGHLQRFFIKRGQTPGIEIFKRDALNLAYLIPCQTSTMVKTTKATVRAIIIPFDHLAVWFIFLTSSRSSLTSFGFTPGAYREGILKIY